MQQYYWNEWPCLLHAIPLPYFLHLNSLRSTISSFSFLIMFKSSSNRETGRFVFNWMMCYDGLGYLSLYRPNNKGCDVNILLYGNLYVYVCVNIYDINMYIMFLFFFVCQVGIPYPEFMGPISLSYQLEPKRMHKRFTNLRICVWST